MKISVKLFGLTVILAMWSEVVHAGTISYQYDTAGRLIAADYADTDITYNYDASGNVTGQAVGESFTVTFTAGANGKIAGTLVQLVAAGGSCSPVTAEPDTGYYFANWTGDYSGTENPLVVTNVTKNMNVAANFTASPVYRVAPGSVFPVTVATALTKVPKVTIETKSKAKVLTPSKNFKPGLTTFECQWTSVKDEPDAYTLSINGAPLTTYFNIIQPTLTSIEPDSGKDGDPITVTGDFFGTQCPKVYMTYIDAKTGKTKKATCKVQKPYVYPDAKDKAGKSVMNLDTGASKLVFFVPKKITAGLAATLVIEFKFAEPIETPFNQ